MDPLAVNDRLRRVRCPAQRVVIGREVAGRHGIRLDTNRDHRLDEAIDFGEILALGRLDHKGARDRERHRRRVEPEVDEALGHVVDGDPGRRRERAQVEDALVRDKSLVARVEQRVVLPQPHGHVVGRENRGCGGVLEPVGAHHAHVRPADRQDAGRTVRCRRHGRARVEVVLRHRMPGQERCEVRLGRNRADTGASAAVRDAERLVQVEVRDVAAEVAEPREPEHRVEVGAVDVDLSPGVVHGLADVANLVLIHAVRGRVGDHERGDLAGVLRDLRANIVQVDVSELVAGDHDDPHAREHRTRGVRAMCARGDQADAALGVAA